jgi:hypothetical protein
VNATITTVYTLYLQQIKVKNIDYSFGKPEIEPESFDGSGTN